MKAVQTGVFVILVIAVSIFAAAGQPAVITGNSAGAVKIGMTVAEVRKAVAPLKLERSSDGEGIALIAVKSGEEIVMTLFAGEEDRDARIDEKAKVEYIMVWDKGYATAAGVHPGMKIADAEKIYGKVKVIVRSEIESREYVTFTNHPAGIDIRVLAEDDSAGVYPQGASKTGTYSANAYIFHIGLNGSAAEETAKRTPEFTSVYTDLTKGCESKGGDEGGHVSTFCKGPGGYQIHFFDAATIYQLNVADAARDWEEPVLSFGLDKLKAVGRVEWRLADGIPFAIAVKDPSDGRVIVRGLKGFERIKFESEGKNAGTDARGGADNEYRDAVLPVEAIDLKGGMMSAVMSGTLVFFDDRKRYVFTGTAGERVTVKIEAGEWSGEEGPVMVGIVRRPNGTTEGAPGGTVFDEVLAEDGEYEIIVSQNAAKSQAENIKFSLTVTRTKGGS
ncbi:MAG TPA: hypothetical protein PKE66_10895 [Pyrinomonadaceae bacterium]|nr:hypothetical protein [Pyrinomonadaceae bacterium]